MFYCDMLIYIEVIAHYEFAAVASMSRKLLFITGRQLLAGIACILQSL